MGAANLQSGSFELGLAAEESIEEIIAETRVDIFSLALSLTGDRLSAQEVVEEVFMRVHGDLHRTPRKDLDVLLHRYTYDASLNHLLDRIGRQTESVDISTSQIGITVRGSTRTIC